MCVREIWNMWQNTRICLTLLVSEIFYSVWPKFFMVKTNFFFFFFKKINYWLKREKVQGTQDVGHQLCSGKSLPRHLHVWGLSFFICPLGIMMSVWQLSWELALLRWAWHLKCLWLRIRLVRPGLRSPLPNEASYPPCSLYTLAYEVRKARDSLTGYLGK